MTLARVTKELQEEDLVLAQASVDGEGGGPALRSALATWLRWGRPGRHCSPRRPRTLLWQRTGGGAEPGTAAWLGVRSGQELEHFERSPSGDLPSPGGQGIGRAAAERGAQFLPHPLPQHFGRHPRAPRPPRAYRTGRAPPHAWEPDASRSRLRGCLCLRKDPPPLPKWRSEAAAEPRIMEGSSAAAPAPAPVSTDNRRLPRPVCRLSSLLSELRSFLTSKTV